MAAAAAAEVAPRAGKRKGREGRGGDGKREEQMGFRVLVYMPAGGSLAVGLK